MKFADFVFILSYLQNGEVECSLNPCPVLDCPLDEQIQHSGECCPQCTGRNLHSSSSCRAIAGHGPSSPNSSLEVAACSFFKLLRPPFGVIVKTGFPRVGCSI